MQIDPDGHGVQTSSPPHRPSGWTWLPGLQMGGRAPHLWWTLDPDTLTPPLPQTAGWATYPVLTIIPDWIQVAFPAAIITDSWSILGHYHRTLPQTECQHASPGRGVCVCVITEVERSCGLAVTQRSLRKENPLSGAWTLGGCRFDWLCCWACWATT